MQTPVTPIDESRRQATLDSLGLEQLPADPALDRITALAREIFSVPIALVSLVTNDKQWFKSRQGLMAPGTGRDISFCGHAIVEPGTMIVPDATSDPRFHDNPLVTGQPEIRFYAGEPIAYEGQPLGTLCIIDTEPRTLEVKEQQQLRSLARWVESEIGIIALRAEHRQLVEQLDVATRESLIDPLTQVWNRRGFEHMVAREVSRADRKSLLSGVMLIDVDRFKQINDTHGHLAGDEILVETARVIRGAVRPQDIVGRFGGDEFVVLVAEGKATSMCDIADRILQRVKAQPLLRGHNFISSVSVGMTLQGTGERFDLETLLEVADTVLYQAKSAGRGCYRMADLSAGIGAGHHSRRHVDGH